MKWSTLVGSNPPTVPFFDNCRTNFKFLDWWIGNDEKYEFCVRLPYGKSGMHEESEDYSLHCNRKLSGRRCFSDEGDVRGETPGGNYLYLYVKCVPEH